MDKSEVELSRLTVKGQCSLPRRIREYLGVKPGDHVAFVVTEHGVLVKKLMLQAATPAQGSAEKAPRAVVLPTGRDAQARGLSEAEVEQDIDRYPQQRGDSIGGQSEWREEERWVMDLIRETKEEQEKNPMTEEEMLRESEDLAHYGVQQATTLGIKPKDINRIIYESRKRRRAS